MSTEPVEPAAPRRRIKEMEVMVADFGRDLNALEAKHPQQLRVVHTLTRQEPAPGIALEEIGVPKRPLTAVSAPRYCLSTR